MLTLHRLSLGYRVLYSSVMLFMTAGTCVHVTQTHLRSGVMPKAVAEWYRGNESDAGATRMMFPKSAEEVMSEASITLSSYTIALIVLGSVFFRSASSAAVRSSLIATFGVFGVAAGAAPLLIRYCSSLFSYLDTAALLALPLLALVMTLLVLRDLWLWRAHGPRIDPRPV